MADKKDVKAQSVDELEVLVTQGDKDAKRELAIRLMKGRRVPQNHPKAVALLEDCVALCDADAMLMLAKCCACGYGMEHNAERAESLICDAANKGNNEAVYLMRLINDLKGRQSVDLNCLSCSHRKKLFRMLFYIFGTGRINGELTIESVCLLMNIISCKAMNLDGQKLQHIISRHGLKSGQFQCFVLSVINRE